MEPLNDVEFFAAVSSAPPLPRAPEELSPAEKVNKIASVVLTAFFKGESLSTVDVRYRTGLSKVSVGQILGKGHRLSVGCNLKKEGKRILPTIHNAAGLAKALGSVGFKRWMEEQQVSQSDYMVWFKALPDAFDCFKLR